MELSTRVGNWFLDEMTALAMVQYVLDPDRRRLEEAMVGQAVAAMIRMTLSDPAWAHELASAIDRELPSVSALAWARRFGSEFGAPDPPALVGEDFG
ncbi:MAG: hypothetical protein R3B59_00065 [Dehalococcoidia bacterium]